MDNDRGLFEIADGLQRQIDNLSKQIARLDAKVSELQTSAELQSLTKTDDLSANLESAGLTKPWAPSAGNKVMRTLKSSLRSAVRAAYKKARETEEPWVIALQPFDRGGNRELAVLLWPFKVLNVPRQKFTLTQVQMDVHGESYVVGDLGQQSPLEESVTFEPSRKMQIWRVCIPQEPGFLARSGGRRNPAELALEGQLRKQGWTYTYEFQEKENREESDDND